MVDIIKSNWFHKVKYSANPRVRLFCFPYSGSRAQAFNGWNKNFSDDIEILVVKFPGRGDRRREKPLLDWELMINELEKAFIEYMDKPFIFYGHCLGGQIAFNLIKRFQNKEYPLPLKFFISGSKTPNIKVNEPLIYNLPQQQFFDHFSKIGGTPSEVFENEDLRNMMEPVLRADILLAELWHGSPDDKVNTPITTLCALSDHVVSVEDMQKWKDYTLSAYSSFAFSGGHFFIHEKEIELTNLIAELINSTMNNNIVITDSNDKNNILIASKLNDTKVDYPDATITNLFEKQVADTPDNIALVFKNQQLTYNELNCQANCLANYLKKNFKIEQGMLIGVCMDKSFNLIISILAILKVGAVYMPLDSSYPIDRLEFMLNNSKTNIVITENSLFEIFPSFIQQIILDNDWTMISKESHNNPSSSSTKDSIAYVNYTSGSTGEPKGVEIPHKGVIRLLFGNIYTTFSSKNVFVHHSPISFDASTFEIWGALLHGAKCAIFPDRIPTISRLKDVINSNSVTTIFLTTALFNIIIDENPEILKNIKHILTGGESHSVTHMKKALTVLEKTKISSVYGPTESTTFATFYPVNYIDLNSLTIPIGKPIANTQIYILNKNLQCDFSGAEGELYIGGDGLARGYLNLPHIAQEKFMDNFSFLPNKSCLYKTGDRVRYLANGNIDILGRVDNQVKIHGFRIEPEEIENVAIAHPNIKQAAVIVENNYLGDKILIAFLVPTSNLIKYEDIAKYMKTKLPKYMVPHKFELHKKLPLTPNGKIDRKSLHNMFKSKFRKPT